MIKFRAPLIILNAASCLLAGCVVGPQYQRPRAVLQPLPASYKESPAQSGVAVGWKPAKPQDAMLRGRWWEIFHDEELNALEDQLDINNQNIKVYFENYMAARALIGQARSQLFPTVTVGPSYTRSQSSALGNVSGATVGAFGVTGSGNSAANFYSIPFDVSWEPDLWGRIQNAIRQAQYDSQVSAADLENERLTEQASLAQYFFEIRGQDALQNILNQTVASDKKLVELTRAAYETGVGDQIAVVEAESSLQNAQAAAAGVGIARAQYEHAIGVLVGKNPSQFVMAVKPLIASPPPVPIGVPSQLLERRPDVAAAERQMAAANAQIGIAYAAYFPTLTLSAGAGFESSVLKSLFNWPSRFWSVGPSVTYTIFDAGLRQATVDQYIATYNSGVYNYRQTVLTAFQQVEDSLASVRILWQEVQEQARSVQSDERTLKLELARWDTGVDPYIDVVTVQNTLLINQQTLVNLHVQEMLSSVQLIASLGGGWDVSQLPTTRQVSLWPSAQERAIQH